MSNNQNNNGSVTFEKHLFWISAFSTIGLLSVFTLESLQKFLSGLASWLTPTVSIEALTPFMALLTMYVFIKRKNRWGKENKELHRGEYIAAGFVAYGVCLGLVQSLIPTLLIYPPNLNYAVIQISALLVINEGAKEIDERKRISAINKQNGRDNPKLNAETTKT